MADVGFDGMAGPDEDLRAAWRTKLEREGKLNAEGGSVRDLVLGPQPRAADRWMDYPQTVGELTEILRQGGYLADRGLATALFVALSLHRPVLLEGEVGVGKTEVAKVLATVFGRRLIRLQCYEGIDTNQALYEWDYARQMLHIRALSERQVADDEAVDKLFGPRYLLERPLLEAVRAGDQAVLLIDEIDRADDEFEAFLLEVLSDFQISIPEIGTIRAESPPLVVLTSNRTRELHDALKRRCLYHWIGYPPPSARWRSCWSASRACRRRWPARWWRRSTGCASWTWPSRPAWPRPSTGSARWTSWARPGWTPRRGGHPRRGGQGTRRPGAGAGQPGGDHLRWLTRARRRGAPGRHAAGRPRRALRSSGCWWASRRELRAAGVAVGTGDVLTYCAAMGRWTRPTCWTCTGRAGPRWSASANTSRSTTRCSGGSSWRGRPGPGAAHAQGAGGAGRGRAGAPGHRARARVQRGRGRAGLDGLGRGDAQAQVVRGLHARRAGRAAADHDPDPADPAPAAHPAHGARPPGARPTCAGWSASRCACTASPAELSLRRRRVRLRPLILILDISGSMADYSRNLLQFAYSASRAAARVEVFCFGTRLTRITKALDHRSPTTRWSGPRGRSSTGRAAPGSAQPGRLRPGLGPPRPVPGRRGGHLLRRPGPGRPGRAGDGDGAAVPASATRWCG